MTYREAKKLHNEDVVTVCRTGEYRAVIETQDVPDIKIVSIMLDDGNWYSHREVR